MSTPVIKEIIETIFRIFEFVRPEYFSTSSSLLLKSLIKNNWVEIRKMNGNISNIIEGEFIKESSKVKLIPTSNSLKNSNSVKVFKTNIKLNIIKVT